MKKSLILFAHGSRDPLWHTPFLSLQRRLQEQDPELIVRCAYLELTQPDLPECVAQLIQMGVQQVRILPLFLGMGRHAREDLPALLVDIQRSHPNLNFEVLPVLGENSEWIDLTCKIALHNFR